MFEHPQVSKDSAKHSNVCMGISLNCTFHCYFLSKSLLMIYHYASSYCITFTLHGIKEQPIL